MGCSGKSDESALSLFSSVKQRLNIPDCDIYCYVKDDSQNQVLSRLYSGGDGFLPPAVAFCDDYLICLYNGNDVWELHIFRTVSIYDNKRIREMLISRRDKLQNSEKLSYYSEETQKRVMMAEVFSFQNFVILAVTDQNYLIKNALQ